jgi:hypothetical protein
MEVGGQFHEPAASDLEKNTPSTQWIKCWMGHRIGVDALKKR